MSKHHHQQQQQGTSAFTEPTEPDDTAELALQPDEGELLIGHKLTVAYNGTPYVGWQIQPGKETVQGYLERAVAKLWGQPFALQGSGRTDAGVHALAQVVSFRAPRRHTAEVLQRALNNNMPETIRVIAAELMPVEFHARFDSTGKTYHYHLLNTPLADPFRQHLCFHVPRLLDVAAMRKAAAHLLGVHDFSSFASNPGYTRTTMVRTMHCVELVEEKTAASLGEGGLQITLKVTADGFLYRMVRNIVGALIKVGHGKMAPDDFRRILLAATRTAAPNTAPPHGLYMARAYYGDELQREIEHKAAQYSLATKDPLNGEPAPMVWEGSAASFAAAVAPPKYNTTYRRTPKARAGMPVSDGFDS
ncbi:MAG: tRNA pseudouridine(38-40) synthase TruA [Candidatus Methylacidiphilales bacterium]|nr:tRNA pseudouridine(38-40) synthase TruA [Candidatus Methylacidiphilales bacterium]